MIGNRPSPQVIAGWLETYAAHTLRDGRCPVCDVPHRCWTWANARADLTIHGLLPDSPQATSGGDQASAAMEENNP